MTKSLPIGIDNFEELIRDGYYFVDKSLLIKELLDTKAKVTLIPRPRRFGKTINMSMVRYFFEKSESDKRHLFNGLNIEQHESCMAHQGQYPVIYLTFKDIKKNNWQNCYHSLIQAIGEEFRRHNYLLQGSLLEDDQKENFEHVIKGTAGIIHYHSALQSLSAFLTKYHGKQTFILIDEYDAPIHAGFLNGYYNEVIEFMRGFLGAGLKGNDNLAMGVITGILRVSKESIFSGINNVRVCSFLHHAYADKFGFLEEEVVSLLKQTKTPYTLDEVKTWYNGYASGDDLTVYNPWSILSFVDNNGKTQPYWINTSDNALIKTIIEQSSSDVRRDLEYLLAGNAIEKQIDENIVFESVLKNAASLWNFLLFTGYLSFDKVYMKNDCSYASLRLPNREVRSFYSTMILHWTRSHVNVQTYVAMLNALVTGDATSFKKRFNDIVTSSLSYFDPTGREPEKFYHALVLGMLVSLSETHEVSSNRESGYGRYDVMVIPKNQALCGIIIEFKVVDADEHETLEDAACAALAQIEEKKYEIELKKRGILKILKLGIAFEGKRVLVKEA